MQTHWNEIGYNPDSVDLNEVDELNVQIWKQDIILPETDSSRPDHSAKYKSVVISGFSKEADEQEIFDLTSISGVV